MKEGLFVLNLAVEPLAHTAIDSLTATLASVLPHPARIAISAGGRFANLVYVAGREHLPGEALAARFRDVERDVAREARADAWVLRDDRAPVELLTDLDLLRGILGGP